MSQETVRREIAAKREYAARLEQRARDATHKFDDAWHAAHLLAEATRLRAEADREERQLAERARPPASPPA
jgi:hypothetical protein